MIDKIEFYNSVPEKVAPEIMDGEVQKLQDDAVKKLEKAQMDKKVRAAAGISEIPKAPESVPKELPMMIFKFCSRAIACPKMELEDDEAKAIAKHLSIIIGAQNSKIYSLFCIIIIILGKVWLCWDAVGKFIGKFKKKKEEKAETDTQKIYEESKKAEVTG